MDLKFVTIRNEVIKIQREKLEFLRKHYESKEKYKTSFEDVVQQYIEHLIATVASKGINQHQDISPPLQVESFWQMHLMETESYRDLESLVLEKMRKHSPVSIEHVKYINHSSVNQPTDMKQSLDTAKVMYTFFGFEFKDERGLVESDEQGNDENGQSDDKSGNIKSKKSSGKSKARQSNDDDDDDDSGSEEILSHDRVEKMIRSLKLENLPKNIEPIPSDNACKYRGVTLRNDIYTSTLHWRSKRYTVYKGNEKENDKENAAKMFSWAYKIAHGEDAYNNAISTSYSSEDNSEADDESSNASSSLEDHINEMKTKEASNKGVMSPDEITALGNEMSSVEEKDIPKHCVPVESSRNSNGYQGIQKHTNGYAVDFFFHSRHFVIHGDKPWSLIGAAKMYAWFYELVRGKEALEKLRKINKKRKGGVVDRDASSKKRKSMSEAQGQDKSNSVQENEERNTSSVSMPNEQSNDHEENLRTEDGSNISKQADKTFLNQQPAENQNEQQVYHSNNVNVQQQNNLSTQIEPKMELGTSSTTQAVRVKSEIQTEPGRVQVGVRGTLQGQEITRFFRVKTKIKCSRMVKSWCESHGINQNPEDWQYIKYKGNEVDPSTTIASLGLKNMEILEVLRGEIIDIE